MRKIFLFRAIMLAAVLFVGIMGARAEEDSYRWDFTTWADANPLSPSADGLHGLTWTQTVRIGYGGLLVLNNGAVVSIPVSKGQSVQILFKSNSADRRAQVTVGGATSEQTVSSANSSNIATITANAASDGAITFKYGGGNGGFPVITSIKRDNNVSIVRSWNFAYNNSTDGLFTSGLNYRQLADGYNGYQINGGYIVVPVTKGQIVTFDVVTAQGSYQSFYKVSDQVDGSPVRFAGVYNQVVQKSFQANADGYIKIERDDNQSSNWMASVRAITIENAPNIAFSSKTCTASLIELNINEPVLSFPTGTQITYSVENTNIAKLGGEAGIGDLMGINTGETNVYATAVYKGITFTDSYKLTIWADEAKYEITDDNTYTLTGNGKLANRVVTEIPKITMEFGATDVVNTTIVRNEGNAECVGTILDSNGWRQVWATYEDNLVHPHQGSFYTFKPKSNGELTIKGYLNNTSQTAYLVDADNLAPVSSNFTASVGITNNNWQGATGMATWAGPEVTTNDGRTTRLAETWLTTVNNTGNVMTQTISGLSNGHYVLKLYAYAASTQERDDLQGENESGLVEGAMDVAYVFGNNSRVYIPAHISTQANDVNVYSLDVEVTNGTLTMGLGKAKAGTNWHMIQIADLEKTDVPASYSFTPVATVTTSDASAMQTTVVDVEAGHTYYLYGNIPSTNGINAWSTYQLKSFSFESNFRYEEKSIVLDMGERAESNPVGQQVIGVQPTVPTYTMELKGDITSATLNPDGTVSNIVGDGGAIVVKATIGSGEQSDMIYYVITVPYQNKVWNLKANSNDEEAQGLAKDMDWGVTYEVRQYNQTTRNLEYLNNSVLTANETLEGNNAAYIGETAGLVVKSDIKKFGLLANGKNLKEVANYNEFFGTSYTQEQFNDSLANSPAFVDGLLRAMLSYDKDDIQENSTTYGAMTKGSTLIVPKLKRGDYVAIKFERHAPNSGDYITLGNAMDLDERPITDDICVLNQGGKDDYGWIEFRAASDGDVTISVSENAHTYINKGTTYTNKYDEGWVHMKQIAVSDEFIDTDLLLSDNEKVASATVLHRHDGSGFTHQYSSSWNSKFTHQEAWHHIKYTLKDIEGSFAPGAISIQPDGTLTVTGGHGTAVVVQKVYARLDTGGGSEETLETASNYVVDMEETKITIIEGGETTQEYPYTWDFTNISDETKGKLTPDNGWGQNADGSYTPNTTGQTNYVQNTELTNGTDDDVKEYDGLGFLTSTDNAGFSTGLTNIAVDTEGDDAGLKIGNSETTTIVVPDVPEGCTVFVRLEPKSDNAVVDNNGTPLDPTKTKVDGTNENLYEIPVEKDEFSDGTAKVDVLLELKDVNVKGIAVTNIFKEARMASASQPDKFYNTDCQTKDIDYSLTGYYTGYDMTAMIIKADGISEVNRSRETAKVEGVIADKPVPANTGLIVYTVDNETLHPLFVPGVNATERLDVNGNMLVGVTFDENSGTKSTETLYEYKDGEKVETDVDIYTGAVAPAESGTYRYLFTNIFNTVGMDDENTADEPAFYRLKAAGGKLKSNRAYLVINQSVLQGASVKALFFSINDDPDDTPTEINIVEGADNAGIDVNGTFYTVSGVKIQGLPAQKGVYIQNGKKIMVK